MGTGRWELVLKVLYPTPSGIRDPLFDQEVAFYVFQLPLWTSLYGWLMGVLIVSGLAIITVSSPLSALSCVGSHSTSPPSRGSFRSSSA